MRTKLDSKSIIAILVGYDANSLAYRCFDPSTNKILISKDVFFNENAMGNFSPTQWTTTKTLFDILSCEDNNIIPSPSTIDISTLHNDVHQQANHDGDDFLELIDNHQIGADVPPSTNPA